MTSRIVILAAICGWMASANPVYIDSRQGLFTSFADLPTVAIAPHAEWEPNHPVNPGDSTDQSAIWISFADTGYGGAYFQPYGGESPVATVYDTFVSGNGMLTLHVWADDTASVLLDGNLLMPAVFTQNVCSGQAIGCRPQDYGAITAALSEGQHTLSFMMYQVGTGLDSYSNPMGLLFTGTAPASFTDSAGAGDPSVPEPSTWAMFASGIAVLAWTWRRRH
jgi:hypothetical protein